MFIYNTSTLLISINNISTLQVKYGCLQLGRKRGDPVAARTYGDSYLRLKSSIKIRCTMTTGDSGGARSTDELGTFDHMAHVVR